MSEHRLVEETIEKIKPLRLSNTAGQRTANFTSWQGFKEARLWGIGEQRQPEALYKLVGLYNQTLERRGEHLRYCKTKLHQGCINVELYTGYPISGKHVVTLDRHYQS